VFRTPSGTPYPWVCEISVYGASTAQAGLLTIPDSGSVDFAFSTP
jgi:hypothetical protein